MKKAFEEYGTIIVVVAVISLLLGLVIFFTSSGGLFDNAFGNLVQSFESKADDTNGPLLTLDTGLSTNSATPTVVGENPYTLSGVVLDEDGVASVTVNGTEATVNPDGTWNLELSLPEEETTELYIVATDGFGNTTTKIRYIMFSPSAAKLDGLVELSAVANTVSTFSTSNFSVVTNLSGGELSVSSSDADIANARLDGNVVTVTAGSVAGTATITVTSAATDTHKTAAATYIVAVENSDLTVDVSGYAGDYDGNAHGITVTCDGATITYSTDGETYDSENPTYTNAGTYTVYYKVEKAGYNTATGSETVTINKAINKLVLSSTSRTMSTLASGSFSVDENASGGALSVLSSDSEIAAVSLNGDTVSITTGSTSGTATITVISAETDNYKATSVTCTLIVKDRTLDVKTEGWTGDYDGEAHGITVNCDGATITYSTDGETYDAENPTYTNTGTYTVYYKVVRTGYATVTGSETVVINRAVIAVDSIPTQKGTLTYDGSVQSPDWNNYDSNKLTIGGTTEATNAGTYEVTFTPTDNYQWSDGTTDAKTETWEISKAEGKVELSANGGSVLAESNGSFTVVTNISGGALSVSSNSDIVDVSQDGDTVTITTGTSTGDVTITVTSAETENYKAAAATYIVTVEYGTLDVEAEGWTGDYDGEAHGITVNCVGATITYSTDGETYDSENPTFTNAGTYTVYYKVEKKSYATVTDTATVTINKAKLSTIPSQDGTLTYNGNEQTPSWSDYDDSLMTLGGTTSGTNAGTYEATFTLSDNYQWSDGSSTMVVSWTIAKSDGYVELSENSGTVLTDSTGTFTVVENTSGGKLNVASSKASVATASISGNVVTITSIAEGEATITVTSAETENYKAATATYIVTVKTPVPTAILYSDGTFVFQMTDEVDSSHGTVVATYPGKTNWYDITYSYSSALPWYSNRTKIKSVIIEDDVSPSSTQHWFDGGNGKTGYYPIESIYIGNSVTSIGKWAFANCRNLTSLTIGNSVETIGQDAFLYAGYNGGYGSLNDIIIPGSVTFIGHQAFCGARMNCVIFEDPYGWYVAETDGATSGTNLTLTDSATAADYLNYTYGYNHRWYNK